MMWCVIFWMIHFQPLAIVSITGHIIPFTKALLEMLHFFICKLCCLIVVAQRLLGTVERQKLIPLFLAMAAIDNFGGLFFSCKISNAWRLTGNTPVAEKLEVIFCEVIAFFPSSGKQL